MSTGKINKRDNSVVSFSNHYGTYCKKKKNNNGLISSLLNMFAMFEIRLSYEDKKLDIVSIKRINCKIETGLNSETNFSWVYDEIITKFLLNAILHHIVMSLIISPNQEMEYEMDKNIHQDWLNKGPWYNISSCSKLHGSRFEYFITQARIDIYNLMCYLVAHDRLELDYKDDEISIGDREIPDNATTKTLESLGATINFIDIWLKLLRANFNAICDAYINAMKDMFKQIPQTIKIALTPKINSKSS